MGELKRIFFHPKFWGILLILLVFNGYVIWKEQQPEKDIKLYYEENYQGNYFLDEKEMYQEMLDKYQKMGVAAAALEMEDYYKAWADSPEFENFEQYEDNTITKEDLKANVRSELNTQIDYLKGYPDFLEKIKVSAERTKEISALGTEESFSARNIDKTVEDYQKLKNVNLKLDNERAVTAFHKSTFTGFLLLAMAVVVVLILLEERKKGLWQFIYAMPKGRSQLALQRCLILFAAVCFSGILLLGETLLITGICHGGFGDLSRAVQSNPEFSGCVLKVSMRMYLFLNIFLKILVCTVVALIFWATSSALKSHVGVFAVLAAIVAGEYFAYVNISGQSAYNQWKYFNLFSFLDSGQTLTTYRNLNFFGYPVGLFSLLLNGVPALFLALCMIVIFWGKQKPFQAKENLIFRLFDKIIFKIKPYRYYSLFWHEIYKVFVRQRCGLVLVVLFLLCICIRDTEEIFFDYATTIYQNYLNQIEGDFSEEKVTYLNEEKNIWHEKIKQSEQKMERYDQLLEKSVEDNNTEYEQIFSSYGEYQQEEKKIENYKVAEEIVLELMQEAERLQSLKKQGKEAGFVNKIGYDMYIGKRGHLQAMKEGMLMLAFLCVALSGIRSYESSQNAGLFLKSTKSGRGELLKNKYWVCAIVTFLIFVPVTLVGFCNINNTYGLGGFGLAVQSLKAFADFPFPFRIGGMLLCIWAVRYLMLVSTAMVFLFLSGKAKNMVLALLLCTLVILVPAGMVFMGFSAVSFFSVLQPVTVIYFWNTYGFESVMCWLPFVCVFVLASICRYQMKKEG